MSIKKISIKVNNSKETIEQYSVTGGENGAGKLKQPLHINAQKDVNYLLIDENTQFAPENIAVKRVDKNLVIAFEGGDVESPDLIIENYFAENGAIGYQDGDANLIIGQYENGQYFPYVPESAVKADAISQLADGQAAGQAIGGDALPPLWAFNPWWLAALVPLIGIPAVAISGGGGGGGHSKVVDHAPIAGDDSAHAKHNTPVTIHVTENDSDVDGDLNPNSIRIVKEGSKGTVTIGKDGKIIYTPNKGEYGVDTITYVVKDRAGHESNVATITVKIDAAPEAKDDSAATKESKPVTIDMENNYSDKDGDVDHSSLAVKTNGGKGFAKFVNGKLVYQPNKGEVGTDTITYTVTDKNGNISEDATITINIDAPPVANDDSAKANKATPVELDVLGNDTDLDGDIDPTTLVVVGEPTKGTVKVVDGKLVYTANPDATGQDTITYLVKDKNGNVSNKATVTIDITEPPVANEDKADTRHNTPVEIDITANDTDLDGDLDKNSVVITQPGTKGTVTIGEDGKLIYTPNKGEHGTDTITYTIKDKNGNVSEEATVTIVIDAAPIANEDTTAIKVGETVTLDVLANDTDLDDDIDPNTLTITNNGEKGTATIVDGKLVYTAKPGVVGTDTITYTVKDKHGNVSNIATVTIEIDAAPVATDDRGITLKDTPVTVDLSDNVSDLDGDADLSTLEIVANGNKGKAEIDANGKLIYTPNPGVTGTDTITYKVFDKHGNVSNTATVTISIKEKGSEAVDVYEKGLRTDGTAGDSQILADGKIILANPEDKPVAEQDIQITKPTTELTSGGKPITWESTDNGFVGKDADGKEVITLTANSTTDNGQTTVDYKVELKGLVDHPAGKDSLNIEFGVKNGTDEVKTEIVVHDDKPSAADVELTVDAPEETSFYANVIISLDYSGSMWTYDSGLPDNTSDGRDGKMSRFNAALNSIETLLDNYQERLDSADTGEVRVSLNAFAEKATAIGTSSQHNYGQAYWCSIDEAKSIIADLRKTQWAPPFLKDIGGNTNYDAALQQIVSIYKNNPKSGEPIKNDSADNTFYFISDGIPNMGNQEGGRGHGIDATSPGDFVPGSPNSDIGEDKWTQFLATNGIRSVAIGIGQDMALESGGKTGKDYLESVAFDGQKGENNDANDVIVLKDMSSLGNILSKYVPNENTIESSFSKNGSDEKTLSFGADGMKSISIEVDGHTYKYDPTTKGITSDNLDKSMWVDFGQGELAVKTDAGGLLSISLGEKNFGHLTYRPGATRPTGMEKETFTLTLTDNDGTNGKSSISVDISKLKESGNTGLNDTDLTALKLFSPESAMELHGVDTDVNATSSHSTGFMNSSLDALQETQSAII
ncbi:TPA: Ig-like domain-containing protein [Providencia alcalifaciens]